MNDIKPMKREHGGVILIKFKRIVRLRIYVHADHFKPGPVIPNRATTSTAE